MLNTGRGRSMTPSRHDSHVIPTASVHSVLESDVALGVLHHAEIGTESDTLGDAEVAMPDTAEFTALDAAKFVISDGSDCFTTLPIELELRYQGACHEGYLGNEDLIALDDWLDAVDTLRV